MNSETNGEERHKLEVDTNSKIVSSKDNAVKEAKDYTNWGVGIAVGVIVLIGVIIEIIINVSRLGGH